ncbi:MAG: RNA polymerase sigma factor [Alphaproteobacteria bacterium]|nr:RNA polymerase sigma factor [Alphaproteobacteria bacterium]
MADPSNSNVERSEEERWREWAAQAQKGDKVAYNRLLKELFPFIRNRIAASLANSDWAEEIAQEVLISVHKSLKTYSPSRPFRPWLMAIVNFRRSDFLRRHYGARQDRKAGLDHPEFLRKYVTDPAHAGEYKDIEAALKSLPSEQRKVFEMIKIQGFTAQEAANKTGMSVSAVKVSAHRTMKKLKEILK